MTDVTPRVTLDRRVSILGALVLVLTLLGQAAAGVSYASKASQRLDTLEQQQADLKAMPAKIERIDERTEQMQKTLDRLEARQ